MLRLSSLTENIRMALRALRSNKLRAALTMLGIIIGVSAVITLVSVGRGVENYIGAAFGSIGTDLLVCAARLAQGNVQSGRPRKWCRATSCIGPSLSMKDVEALQGSAPRAGCRHHRAGSAHRGLGGRGQRGRCSRSSAASSRITP